MPSVDIEWFVASDGTLWQVCTAHTQQMIAITVNGSRDTNVNAVVIYRI